MFVVWKTIEFYLLRCRPQRQGAFGCKVLNYMYIRASFFWSFVSKTSWVGDNTDYSFDHFPMEFEAHIHRFWSTQEYYRFWKYELQTPSESGRTNTYPGDFRHKSTQNGLIEKRWPSNSKTLLEDTESSIWFVEQGLCQIVCLAEESNLAWFGTSPMKKYHGHST